jgi:hypothetical protein
MVWYRRLRPYDDTAGALQSMAAVCRAFTSARNCSAALMKMARPVCR